MNVLLDRFPGGVQKALTMSYDDGVKDDIRLIEIFNQFGIKGTFHINSGLYGKKDWDRLEKHEVEQIYNGHEISAHGYTHKKMTAIPNEEIINEIIKDREELEEITGKPIRGMSYPFGAVNSNVESIMQNLGIDYARVVQTTGSFDVPTNFLQWEGTCHHNDNLLEYGRKFLEETPYQMMIMYVWGHSFEFRGDNNWDLIETFCKMMGGHQEIWYATNIEICDYVNAVRRLRFTVNQESVWNPSAIDVWISVDDQPVLIKGGETRKLKPLVVNTQAIV